MLIHTTSRTLLASAALATGLIFSVHASAANIDGQWIGDGAAGGNDGGNWSVSTKWASGNVADGSGFTADFSTIDLIGTSTTVSLDSARTIGNLIFGDQDTSTASKWTLNNGGNSANVLTLAGASPTITVNLLSNTISSTTANYAVITAAIAGSDGLTKDGAGMLVLTGANTYSGGTTLTNGYLRLGNASALGSGALSVTGGQLQVQSNVAIANTITVNGGSIFSYSGGDFSGSVTLQANTAISTYNGNNNALIFSGTLDVGSSAASISAWNASPVNITGSLAGSGSVNITNGNVLISGDNSATYTGTTQLNRGNLLIGNDAAMGTGTFAFNVNNDTSAVVQSSDATARTINNPVTIAGGGNGNSIYYFGTATTGDLTFTGDVTLLGTRKWRVANATTTFSGTISGNYGITKDTSTGTLVLSGDNAYTGSTAVNAGTLLVNNTTGSGTGSGNVSVASGALLGGTGSIAGNVTFAAGSTFLSLIDGPLTVDGLLSIAGNIATADTLTAASYTVLNFTSGSRSGDFLVDSSITDQGYHVVYTDTSVMLVNNIPEPATLTLLGGGVGLIGLGVGRRKRSA